MEYLKSESIQCPMFSGENADYSIWWTRFTAFAMVKRFDTVLLAGEVQHTSIPLTHADGLAADKTSTDPQVILTIAIMKENDAAMAYFTLAFKTARLMRIIRGAKTTGYPGGLADLVCKALVRYYTPRDMTSKVELNIRKTKVVMKPKEHPKVIFEQMSELEEEFRVTFGLDDQIPILIGASPPVYHSMIVQEQRSKGTNLSIIDLEDCMTDLFRTTYGMHNTGIVHNETEMGMAGVADMVCHHCKKKGHKKADCYSLKNEQKRQGNNNNGNNNNGNTVNNQGSKGSAISVAR
jgi:hypothetical protein